MNINGAMKKPGKLLTSLSNVRTFASLKNPAYRFYFFGMAGQWGAMNMQMVTRSLLIYRLTGSAAILGLLALATGIPTLIFSLFGGVIADRLPKKHVIQIGQLASALVAASVAVALTTGYLSPENPGSWWVLIVNSALQGTIMGLMMPSRQAIIPEIVNDDQVMNAVALNSLGMNTLRLMAPALAGFLIDFFDFAAVFYTMTGMYIMAVVFTTFIKTHPVAQPKIKDRRPWMDIFEGFKYMWGRKTIMYILGFTLFAIVLSMPYQMMMPVFTEDILQVGATGLGVLMSVSGIGAMAAALAVASLPNKRRGLVMLGSSLILGITLAAFAFSNSWPISIVLMVFIGLGQTGRQAVGTTLLQSYSNPEYLGRVMSVNMMDTGLSSIGTFVTGVLAETIGVQWAIGGFALGLVFLAVGVFLFIPRVRQLN